MASVKQFKVAGDALASFATISVAYGQVTVAIPSDPIRIDSGLVSGTLASDGLKTYFGIPFAAPPVRVW